MLQTSTAEDSLGLSAQADQPVLEQLLADEKAALIDEQARLATLRDRQATEVARPGLARQRLGDARGERETTTSELNASAPIGETREITEARRLHLESRAQRLSAEINKLEQEILTHDVRLQLLEKQQELASLSVERARIRARILEDRISDWRNAEATQALQEAVTAGQDLVNQPERVRKLAVENIELGDRLTRRSLDVQEASDQRDEASDLLGRLNDDLNATRNRLAIAGLNRAMGQLLIDQKRSLPNLRSLQNQAVEREQLLADVGLEQVDYREQRRALRDIDSYVESIVSGLPAGEAEPLREQIKALAESRHELIVKSIDATASYLRVLGELDMASRQFSDGVRDYKTFLDSTLLWVRNTSPIQPSVVLSIPGEIENFFSGDHWKAFFGDFRAGLRGKPQLLLCLAVLLILGLLRTRLLAAIDENARFVGRIREDRISYSIMALFQTLLAAAALPMVIVTVGVIVNSNIASASFSDALSTAFIWFGIDLLIIQFFIDACREKGLLRGHCGWTDAACDKLGKELRWFLVVFPTVRLIGDASYLLDAGGPLGGLAVVGSIGSATALALLLFRLFTPAGGILTSYLQQRPRSFVARTRSVWLTALMSVLPLLIILWLAGYNYTGDVLATSFYYSFWLLLWILVLHDLLTRWLVLGYNRAAFLDAIERRDAAREARRAAKDGSSDGTPAEEAEFEWVQPQIDFKELSSNSRGLLKTLIVLVTLFWLWLIWAPIIPALGILNDLALWTRSGVVNGEIVPIPVTAADFLLAVIVGITTVALARGLPALLELMLLQNTEMTMGGRYTATTLLRYSIAGIGLILVVSMLGISWSKAQWLVAALGVGIGFGLQEIIANFICGLVLLFDRPIRVGDTITVGDTSGVVTRIQIRATTIMDWDHRELLVPNKEFITGRVLNWTLSDDIVRLVITIGIAYGSDVALAMKLARKAATEYERVLDDPEPSVIFSEFGDNSLRLDLRVFLSSFDYFISTKSDLHQEINRQFADAGIQIAFPQRDVHLDTSRPLEIQLRPATE